MANFNFEVLFLLNKTCLYKSANKNIIVWFSSFVSLNIVLYWSSPLSLSRQKRVCVNASFILGLWLKMISISMLMRKPQLLWKLMLDILQTVWMILLLKRRTKIWTNFKEWSYNWTSSNWKYCMTSKNNHAKKSLIQVQ